jgi:hypothetical protein
MSHDVLNQATKEKILSKWADGRDTYQPDNKPMAWLDVSKGGYFPYEHKRTLLQPDAEQALKYIKAITAKYPMQLRYAMAVPLWNRFAQTWCETGDLKKALRGI